MINTLNYYPKTFYTSDGDINFYASKSHSKHTLNGEFDIKTTLTDYNLNISLYKKKLNTNRGLIQSNFTPIIQFVGEILEFDFMDVSETESTVILNGDLRILSINKQNSFIGNIKKIDNVIYLNSNFILNIEDYSFDKVFTCSEIKAAKSISIELELQLK